MHTRVSTHAIGGPPLRDYLVGMSSSNEKGLVLVTGATGFLGLHCIVQLLQAGWAVRGTVRDLRRADGLRALLSEHVDGGDRLSFAAADLADDQGWAEALAGCRFVLHVASPVLSKIPKDPNEVILPAREGTLRVLRAAAAAGVERVVLTSSTAAVIYGHARDGQETYDEDHWSVLNSDVQPYEQSKTLAERAAWDFVASLHEGQRFELVAMNPGLILGPLLEKDFSVSGEVVKKLMMRELPGTPDVGWAMVDVRDVASAHVTAMTHPQAPGNRFILASEHVPMNDIARILASHYGQRGFKVPTRRLPSWVVKAVALLDKTTAMVVPELGKRQDVSSARARSVLGWTPRPIETTVIEMAESMIARGVLPSSAAARA
jgi:dihydroflavonol-4-reductase